MCLLVFLDFSFTKRSTLEDSTSNEGKGVGVREVGREVAREG
jgi:hypothetical protein